MRAGRGQRKELTFFQKLEELSIEKLGTQVATFWLSPLGVTSCSLLSQFQLWSLVSPPKSFFREEPISHC